MIRDSIFDISVFILSSEGGLVSLNEYDAFDFDGEFVLLTNDVLNQEYNENNSFCLYRKWLSQTTFMDKELSDKCQWQSEDNISLSNIPDIKQVKYISENDGYTFSYNDDLLKEMVEYHLSGQKQTDDIILNIDPVMKTSEEYWSNYGNEPKILNKTKYIPAVMKAYNTIIKHNGKYYHGFLPAIGQLVYISENIQIINNALEKIHGDDFKITPCEFTGSVTWSNHQMKSRLGGMAYMWWSSTLYDSQKVWMSYYGMPFPTYREGDNCHVLPLFSIND